MSSDEKDILDNEKDVINTAKPTGDSKEELSEAELDQVAGGSSYSPEVRGDR
jgi:hypothetical protein